ncbi:MAG: hypothetical protein WA823_01110 [Candidatus Acidiferrales bacterium]
MDRSRLHVIVGGGNWISWECAFVQEFENSPEEIVRGLSQFGERRAIRAVASPRERVWFRTHTRPSLHFLLVHADGRFLLAGHVDAAAPFPNPFVHLMQDYLPARGVGAHPAPAELWREWLRVRMSSR